MKRIITAVSVITGLSAFAAPATAGTSRTVVTHSTGNMVMDLGSIVPVYVEAALEITSTQADRLAGAQLTAIRFALGAEPTEQANYVFVTTDLQDESRRITQYFNEAHFGWNEVALEYPYDITGEPFYIGIGYRSQGDALSMDGEEDNDAANHVRVSQSANLGSWGHQSGGALNIAAVVEGESLPLSDIAILRHDIRPYACAGSPTPMELVVRNNGAETVTSLEVECTVDDGLEAETKVMNLEGLALESGRTALLHVGDLMAERNGILDLTLCVTGVNGYADEYPEDNSVTVPNIVARRDNALRRVVVERFSTMECVNCPGAEVMAEGMMQLRSGVIDIVHHSGFRTDKLTVPESETYLWLYSGACYTPGVMLDRTNMSAYGANDGTNPTAGPVGLLTHSTFAPLLDRRRDTPALIGIAICADYDASSRQISVSASGSVPSGDVTKLAASNPVLNLMVVEDSVYAWQMGSGRPVPEEGYCHNSVLRHVLTPVWGEKLEFTDASFQSSVHNLTLPADWNAEHLRVVAFVSNYKESDPNDCGILNAAQVSLTDTNAIGSVASDTKGFKARVRGGMLVLEGAEGPVNIFTPAGQTVLTLAPGTGEAYVADLVPGLYLVHCSGTVRRIVIR